MTPAAPTPCETCLHYDSPAFKRPCSDCIHATMRSDPERSEMYEPAAPLPPHVAAAVLACFDTPTKGADTMTGTPLYVYDLKVDMDRKPIDPALPWYTTHRTASLNLTLLIFSPATEDTLSEPVTMYASASASVRYDPKTGRAASVTVPETFHLNMYGRAARADQYATLLANIAARLGDGLDLEALAALPIVENSWSEKPAEAQTVTDTRNAIATFGEFVTYTMAASLALEYESANPLPDPPEPEPAPELADVDAETV